MHAEPAPLSPEHPYLGIEFHDALWEHVSSCCIEPPDAAFREELHGWRDAECRPRRKEHIVLFWRMDEPEDPQERRRRPRIHTIFAAFTQLYTRCTARSPWCTITLHLLRRGQQGPQHDGDLPAVNFQLWQTVFAFPGSAFRLEEHRDSTWEQGLPPPHPLPADALCRAARQSWIDLVTARVEFLIHSIHDAESYEMLMPLLGEWFTYGQQLTPRCLDWHADTERLHFTPWYGEVLRRMPRLNAYGLTIVPLPGIGRYGVRDHWPEEGRRFRYKALKPHAALPDWTHGLLLPAGGEDEALPYDAAKQLHLLPVPCENVLREHLRLGGIPTCFFYEEDWLGRDYNWDKPLP